MTSILVPAFTAVWLIPLMFLALVAAVPCSVLAFFVAFFDRALGRIIAGVALAAIAAFFLLQLIVNDWDFNWLAILLFQHVGRIVCSTLFLSLVAILVPFRREKRTLPSGQLVPGAPRWSIFALSCVVAGAVIGYGVAQYLDGRHGEQKTMALLAGDPSIHFTNVEINWQQRRVVCTDTEVLRYLEGRFRHHDRQQLQVGLTYELILHYAGGGSHSVYTYWSDGGDFFLSLPEHGDGGPSHAIRLQKPRPPAVSSLVEFLHRQDRDAEGTVLILQPGASRFERDETLVAK